MTKLAFALLLLAPAVAAADNHLMGNHKTVTYDCGKDAKVAVMGNDNTVTLTGTCDTISVTGNHNTLAGPEAATVTVSGNHNALSVDKITSLNVSGNDNTVTVVKLATADQGPRNSMTGNGNKILTKEPARPKK